MSVGFQQDEDLTAPKHCTRIEPLINSESIYKLESKTIRLKV